MPTFNDNSGHDWLIKFDGVLLSDMKDAHGINLADISGETYLTLETDQAVLTKVILFLCRKQMEAEGVNANQFANILCGEVAEAAIQAIWGAAKVFFRPKLWSALQSGYKQRMEAKQQWDTLAPMMAMLNQPEMPAAMREAVMGQLATMMEQMSLDSPPSTARAFASGRAANQSKPVTELLAPVESAPAL